MDGYIDFLKEDLEDENYSKKRQDFVAKYIGRQGEIRFCTNPDLNGNLIPNRERGLYVIEFLQEFDDKGEIVDCKNRKEYEKRNLISEKEQQIETNNRLCKAKIEAIASISDQLNMLLEQASKVEGANEKLKDFETKKNKILEYNKQLKDKINNSTSTEEIKKCVFNIEEIQEINGIEEIK